MGFNNPAMPWSELERRLSDNRVAGRPSNVPPSANGGDSPAWSRKRQPFEPQVQRRRGSVPYAELHCHSNFSFLDGASHPEELVEEAARLGLEALALTDHDGFYGVVRFAEAAREVGMPTVFGAELSLELRKPQNGEADPEGHHLVVLARDPQGYARLARTLERGAPAWPREGQTRLFAVRARAGARRALARAHRLPQGHGAACARARRSGSSCTCARRSRRSVRQGQRGRRAVGSRRSARLGPQRRARRKSPAAPVSNASPPTTCTTRSSRAARSPPRSPRCEHAAASTSSTVGCRPPRPLTCAPASSSSTCSAAIPASSSEQRALGLECAFDLHLVAPDLPPYPCPDGLDEMQFLRKLAYEGADAPLRAERRSHRPARPTRRSTTSSTLIESLGFPGYFLVVWDIVEFCRRSNIYCQGRGSAANSAVCYALGITNADAVALGLLFERFLSPERDGPPDIDIDIESTRREEAIQYVYERYDREHAAQVANVITYRAKSSIRDMAKALGYSTGQQDAWSKQADPWGPLDTTIKQQQHEHQIPLPVLKLAKQVEHFPRHLGIHSGGMVICDRPIVEVCPIEWGRFTGRNGTGDEPIRSVLQWDKDDCAAAGLVKFDLLGLGMLSALHHTLDFVHEHHHDSVELATIPQDDAVYDMLCRADSVGVFQVESRAQMATLPRLKPRCFYDLVVEVALIRPGPIQGGSVHPYIRRRNGTEPVTYLHPLLEPVLEKTLGVPLFQEQLMQIAIEIAGFTPGEADQLRQAMASKRSRERMERIRQRLYDGMAERGVVGDIADQMWETSTPASTPGPGYGLTACLRRSSTGPQRPCAGTRWDTCTSPRRWPWAPTGDRRRRNHHAVVMGRITPGKGQHLAARLAHECGFDLVLAGPVGPYRQPADLVAAGGAAAANPDARYWQDEVRPLVDGIRVRWIGTVAGQERNSLVASARVALFPLQWEEPGGTAVVEASPSALRR